MAKIKEMLTKKVRLDKFIAGLNCLSKRHNLIITKEIKPDYLQVYDKNSFNQVGKIHYKEKINQYQEHLNPNEAEIRDEIKKTHLNFDLKLKAKKESEYESQKKIDNNSNEIELKEIETQKIPF